jgi:hypothetical protein
MNILKHLSLLLFLLLPNLSLGQAVWRGNIYSHPVCNNPNCKMCNSIRAQLATPTCTGPNCSLSLSEVRVAGVVKPLTHVTELVPTPEEVLSTAVELLELNPESILIEPGCGDGRLLSKASKVCRSIGIELNPDSADKARTNAPDAIVVRGDALIYHYESATHLYMYLYPDLMDKIIPKLKKGTRIVSYMHTTPSIQWKEHVVSAHKFYIGVK